MLDDQEFLMRLRASKYDLLVLEMFHLCPAGIAHISGIRKIILSSALGMTMTHYELTGLPITLSNTPGVPLLSFHSGSFSFPNGAWQSNDLSGARSQCSVLLWTKSPVSENALFGANHFRQKI